MHCASKISGKIIFIARNLIGPKHCFAGHDKNHKLYQQHRASSKTISLASLGSSWTSFGTRKPSPKGRFVEGIQMTSSADDAPSQSGSGPKRFSPLSPAVASQMNKTIKPIIGTKNSSCHQPLRSISWSRRAATANVGMVVMSMK